MKLIRKAASLKPQVRRWAAHGLKIGFVPTMGALHEGHLALVRRAVRENDAVVVSLFVNPLQFGPKEGYRRYPRNLARDRQILSKEKVSVLFAPRAEDFYPADFQTQVTVGPLSRPLCGRTRPNHFTGVATVVLKMLNLVCPHTLYLGQKDYQQVRVLSQMIEDLALPVRVRFLPIVRHKDGLAMSSRNALLASAERAEAPGLYRSLLAARARVRRGQLSASAIRRFLIKAIGEEAPLARIDYAEIVDARSLAPVVILKKGRPILIALAVFYSAARLIDNLLIDLG